jgi:hypothetical protein
MPESQEQPSSLDYPELFFGIAGPIGVDMDLIAASLATAISNVGYTSTLTKLTNEMQRFAITDPKLAKEIAGWEGDDTYNTYMRKMSQANALRKQYDDPAVLARIAIDAIRSLREERTRNQNIARAMHAYIIRQLKRPEEVALLRKVYGRQFVLISAYAPESRRREQLCRRLSNELSTDLSPADVGYRADKLIERDASEEGESLGQQLRETFHLADVDAQV